MPPVALFWGEKDHILPAQQGREAAGNADHLDFVVYPRAGHFPHLDVPQRFAADLVKFLNDPNRLPARVAQAIP